MPPGAATARAAGIEMLTCDVDENLPGIRAAAPGVFLQAAHVQGTIHDDSSAIREGFVAIETGADAFYFSGLLRLVATMAREGIPVTSRDGTPGQGSARSARPPGKRLQSSRGSRTSRMPAVA